MSVILDMSIGRIMRCYQKAVRRFELWIQAMFGTSI